MSYKLTATYSNNTVKTTEIIYRACTVYIRWSENDSISWWVKKCLLLNKIFSRQSVFKFFNNSVTIISPHTCRYFGVLTNPSKICILASESQEPPYCVRVLLHVCMLVSAEWLWVAGISCNGFPVVTQTGHVVLFWNLRPEWLTLMQPWRDIPAPSHIHTQTHTRPELTQPNPDLPRWFTAKARSPQWAVGVY